MKRSSWVVCSLLGTLGAATLAFGQDAASSTAMDAAWKQEMEHKIDVLTEELEKSKLNPETAPTQVASTAQSIPTTISPYSFGPGAGKVYGVDHGLSIGGYGEMIYSGFHHQTAYSHHGDDNEPKIAEWNLPRFVLYTGYKFTGKIVFNSELEIENANSGKQGEAEAEFAYLDFALSKPLGFRVGELLVPVGLTNEYHEPTVFDTVLRPEVEQFIIPTTWHENGAGYYGKLGPFAYRGYLMAGLRAKTDDDSGQSGQQGDIGLQEARQEGSRSRAQNLAYTQRLDYVGIPGFVTGASLFIGNAGQGETTPDDVKIDAPVTLWEVHQRAEYKGFTMRLLYTQATVGGAGEINAANGFTGNESVGQYLWGGYAEVGYNLLTLLAPTSTQNVSPIIRYERYNTQGTVPGGFSSDPANDRHSTTFGMAYKPIPRVVLKADYQLRGNHAGTGIDQFDIGVGYEF